MAKRSKYDVVCIGDVVMDAFITLEDKEARVEWDKAHEHPRLSMSFADKIPYKDLTVVPAVGNASNVAVGASRLGLSAAIITAIGGDHYGEEILDRYHKEGVSSQYVKINKSMPTNYHFVLTYKTERTILIKHQKYEYYDPMKLDSNTDWVYFSSIAEHTLPFHAKVAEYLKKFPNIKMGFNPGTFQLRFGAERLREIYKHTYVLFVNREEAGFVLHSKNEDINFLFKGLHKLGPKVVVITDGPAGAYASDGTDKYFMPAYPDPKPPISRTGAGDAFSTGFFCGLVYGLSIYDALRWAPIESMHVVQYFGAQTGLLSKPALLSLLKRAPKNYLPKKI